MLVIHLPYDPALPPLGVCLRNGITWKPKDLHKNVLSSPICNGPELEITQNDRIKAKQTVVYFYTIILLSKRKEGTTDFCNHCE